MLFLAKELETRDNQQHSKNIENPCKTFDQSDPAEDENRTHENGAHDSPKEDLVLVTAGNLEIREEQQEHEEVVHTQRQLHKVTGQKLHPGFAPLETVHSQIEQKCQADPDADPANRFAKADLVWFELLRQEYQCPVAMLHVPYLANGRIERHHVDYVVQQLRTEVIPKLEQVSGRRYDEARLSEMLALSAKAEDDFVWVLESAKNIPSPIDAYFGGVYYIGPIFTAFRGTSEGVEYYRVLREEIAERIRSGLGPITPEGAMESQRYRLVVEGPPNWTSFREFWKMFYDEGAVVVASSYTKVGGLYDRGFRHDPNRPLESLAEYCLGCYTNLGLPARVDLLERYIREYRADGFMINSVKSCNSFSVGQLLMLRQLEQRTGVPGGFIESDLVDPRYFSTANIKNRIESYMQMLAQRRVAEVTA